jgi:Rha family phage regulatory protein
MTEGIDATRSPIVRLTDTNEAMADSRDVAAYFGKEHRNVVRSIENLISHDHGWGMRNFEQTPYLDNQNGQTYNCFRMTRSGFSMLAMGFTGGRAFTFKVRYIEAFDAMESELRNRRSFDPATILESPAAMRGLLLTYTEKVIALEGKVSELGPKAEALDRIATADGSLNVTEAAKALQMRPKDLFTYLRAHGWIYRRAGAQSDLGYQSKVQSGLLEHKITTVLRADGSERITEQVRVTPKGLAALAKLFPSSISVAA